MDVYDTTGDMDSRKWHKACKRPFYGGYSIQESFSCSNPVDK